jgi:protein-S-isoprenylcysteine O-methyltransferase Ste14
LEANAVQARRSRWTVVLIRGGAFILASIPIVWLSLPSLRDPRSHGFYRFFAFECILGVGVLNASQWFVDPLTAVHILSWILLLASAYMAIHGFWALRAYGKPVGSIEATTELVTAGPYRWIRHPLYASLLYFNLGVFFKAVSLPAGILALLAVGFLELTARTEERENLARFGDVYADYMTRTKRFVPGIL